KFAVDPAALIEAVADDPFASDVLAGWTHAAIRQAAPNAGPDADAWLAALADHWLPMTGGKASKERNEAYERLAAILEAMSQSAAEATIVKLLDHRQRHLRGEDVGLFEKLRQPWTADFGLRFLEQWRLALEQLYAQDFFTWVGAAQ